MIETGETTSPSEWRIYWLFCALSVVLLPLAAWGRFWLPEMLADFDAVVTIGNFFPCFVLMIGSLGSKRDPKRRERIRGLNIGFAISIMAWPTGFVISQPLITAELGRATQEMKPLALALSRFVDQTGHPPAKLEDLVPTYLDSIPRPSAPALGVCQLHISQGQPDRPAWWITVTEEPWRIRAEYTLVFMSDVSRDVFPGRNRFRLNNWTVYTSFRPAD